MARILVIDDSDAVVHAVAAALAPDGHEITSLDVFTRLPQILRREPPDLILLDLEIPVLSGVQFGQFVRRFQREPVPILIHSSRPEEELAAAARQVSAHGWVRKGAGPAALRQKVAQTLGEHAGAVQEGTPA